MKIHLLSTVVGTDRVEWFHSTMFHGRCAVVDLDYLSASFEEKTRMSGPLELICNGWQIPDFFLPRTRVVVSSRVKEALAGIETIAFRPVEFVKLIEVPYAAGDMDYPGKSRAWIDPGNLFERRPDVPRLHRTKGGFHELILPTIYEIGPEGNGGARTTLTVPWLPYSRDRHEVSEPLVNRYPLLNAGYLILNQAAFSAVSPFLDWDYFECLEAEI